MIFHNGISKWKLTLYNNSFITWSIPGPMVPKHEGVDRGGRGYGGGGCGIGVGGCGIGGGGGGKRG